MDVFEIGYSYKTFSGIIGAGVFDVECEGFTLDQVKADAFRMVTNNIRDQHDEESIYSWDDDFQNIQISVTEKT